MQHQPGCSEREGGDCPCFRYGDIVHYRWSFGEPKSPIHSVSFVVGLTEPYGSYVLLYPLADTSYRFSINSPITSKNAAAYDHCTAVCPFNPDYEGAPS